MEGIIRIACMSLFLRYVHIKTGKSPYELTKNDLKTLAALLLDQCEFYIRDEYGLDEEEKASEYMMRKVNLSSLYGSVQEDFIDEGNREIYGG